MRLIYLVRRAADSGDDTVLKRVLLTIVCLRLPYGASLFLIGAC
jgi:hypothetical protein